MLSCIVVAWRGMKPRNDLWGGSWCALKPRSELSCGALQWTEAEDCADVHCDEVKPSFVMY
ncbi:hypothetical protein ES705_24877 [subsurface metagenome]